MGEEEEEDEIMPMLFEQNKIQRKTNVNMCVLLPPNEM